MSRRGADRATLGEPARRFLAQAQEAIEADGSGEELAGERRGAAWLVAVGRAEEGVERAAGRVAAIARVGGAEEAAADHAAGEIDELDHAARVGADRDSDQRGRWRRGHAVEEEEVAQARARDGGGRGGSVSGGERAALDGEVAQGRAVLDRVEAGVEAGADC